ncbi:homocysteine S-methyltransferase family protein [Sedimenticola hydrogenitrophicus]|uniref:homocysteine S-methyltransferase family protein n=1 Tax=Sedimenticola hydrogenitrophicus TaxID=2967975 RepID=UPI0023B12B47|nr:homocysteine S-methyltransferase family protein [Sedimenticola hydrogenitrophicus]
MSHYRDNLPQLKDTLFLTDGGLETTLVFHKGMELPYFAAFDLLRHDAGVARLRRYYEAYIEITRHRDLGFLLEAPTWRANADWRVKLGYDARTLAAANRRAIDLMLELRDHHETPESPMVISGNLGPRGDGYQATARMSAAEARRYHAHQIETFADTAADMVAAFTLTYVDEAIGIVQAAREAAIPVAISFTLETDGRIPAGETLAGAIAHTDHETDGYAAYYMINCAHPTHFMHLLQEEGEWRERTRGLRANASKRSHAELDESPDLDAGNPGELGLEYRRIREWLPRLSVLGGCCGTDHRHLGAICAACT